MRIYTRQGDKGLTRLADGAQLAKDDMRVETYGAVDELNSQIGLLIAEIPSQEAVLLAQLVQLQQELFDLGGELAFSSAAQNAALWQVNEGWTARLEQQIDAYSAQLPVLRNFILPSGSRAAAQAHVVRTLTRRCERLLLGLSRAEQVNPAILPYLNRLSDWFFTVARYLLACTGTPEVLWVKAADRG
ncbi:MULTISPECIES: cob(I)yrinic acid a,c-diamide adenosyltransferase [unclassified Aeromonas]|uniref:cob(I)yrinic acid a,c-diamide adenosyltransferase n=1 Tax=unclassified Aeromonas TaxID=257493 RepID=UPI001C43A324|nr:MULTISPECIES: cob(I)yrinic acid a,c-diamide adenosyltransferase [unclassified Aeromonas]MBV7414777.1 cob(I)yrinic acid a,c-diamide adenosyltransferase [Aeromonas sp. sif2433]MBV7437047.1 cob(I)yrinic acid a,c-diamide adenosyltransferase [Aeromonas sp. sif2416]